MFDSLVDNLSQVKLPSGRDWMVDHWINTVNAAYTPELDLEEPPEKKPADEFKPKWLTHQYGRIRPEDIMTSRKS